MLSQKTRNYKNTQLYMVQKNHGMRIHFSNIACYIACFCNFQLVTFINCVNSWCIAATNGNVQCQVLRVFFLLGKALVEQSVLDRDLRPCAPLSMVSAARVRQELIHKALSSERRLRHGEGLSEQQVLRGHLHRVRHVARTSEQRQSIPGAIEMSNPSRVGDRFALQSKHRFETELTFCIKNMSRLERCVSFSMDLAPRSNA